MMQSATDQIATDRLLIRPVSVDDVATAYVEALNDPEVVRWTEARHIRWNHSNVLDYVRRSNAEGVSQLLGFFLKESGRHIGNARLFNVSAIHRRAELGIMIFDKSQWSKGYGTEALRAMTRYVFDTLKLHKLCADYYAPNTASARIFRKAGFEAHGIFKQHFLLEGAYVDSIQVAKIHA